MRILFIILLIQVCCMGRSFGQIACPDMGFTQVDRGKMKAISAFRSKVRKPGKMSRLDNYFTGRSGRRSNYSGKDPFSSRTKRRGTVNEYSEFSARRRHTGRFSEYDAFVSRSKKVKLFSEHDEFSYKSRKKGRFRSFDEFASRKHRAGRFHDFDEFAYRSSKRSMFAERDEFATRSKRTRKVNTDSQFNSRTVAKKFNREKFRRDEFTAKKKRSRLGRSEYTPYATTISPSGGAVSHRKPQMGLWGGSIGNRSGRDSRPATPLPEPEKKEE